MELGSEPSPGDPGGGCDWLGSGDPCGGLVPLFEPLGLLDDSFELLPAWNKFAGSSAAIQGDSQLRLCIDATTGALFGTEVSACALGGAFESTGVLMLGFGCKDRF